MFVLKSILSFLILFLLSSLNMADLFNKSQTAAQMISGWTKGTSTKPIRVANCTGKNQQFVNKLLFGPIGSGIRQLQKIWTNLPKHFAIKISMDIVLHNQWQNGQTLTITVDGTLVKTFNPVQKLISAGYIQQCYTNSSGDQYVTYTYTGAHTNSQVTVLIQNNINALKTEDTVGYFLHNIEISVDRCHQTCATCSGQESNQCLTCPPNSVQTSTSCKCGTIFYSLSDNTCTSSCPTGYYGYQATKECLLDNCNSNNCYKCNNVTNLCIKCLSGFGNFRGTCVANCPFLTTLIDEACQEIYSTMQNPQYLIRTLGLEADQTNKIDLATQLSLGSILNFGMSYGDRAITYCNSSKPWIGGFMIFGSGSIKKQWVNLAPHWQVVVKVKVLQTGSWAATDKIQIFIDDVQALSYTESGAANQVTDCGFVGQNSFTHTATVTVAHTASILKVEIKSVVSNTVGKNVGFRELAVILDRCPDGCTACNLNQCTTCGAGLTPWNGICVENLDADCRTDWAYIANDSSLIDNSTDPTQFTSLTADPKFVYLNSSVDCGEWGFSIVAHAGADTCLGMRDNLIKDNDTITDSGALLCLTEKTVSNSHGGFTGSSPVAATTTTAGTIYSVKRLKNSMTLIQAADSIAITFTLQPHLTLIPWSNITNANSFKWNCPKTCSIPGRNSYLLNGQFVLECPVGFFPNSSTGICQKCHSSCFDCSYGTSNQNCSACTGALILNILAKTCVSSCPTTGYYVLSGFYVCGPCNPSCASCSGPNPNNCLSCPAGMTLINSQCFDCQPKPAFPKMNPGTGLYYCEYCTSSQYGDLDLNACASCHPTCKTCDQKTQYDCKSCIDQAYLAKLTHACISCLSTQYGDNVNETCKNCSTICTMCNEGTEYNCTKCKDFVQYLAQNRTCISCPTQYYGNLSYYKCDPCFPTCLTCNGPNKTDCRSCDLSEYAYYDVEHRCLPALQPGYVDFSTVTYYTCPDKTYGKSETKECLPCIFPCISCFGTDVKSQCKSCDVQYAFYNKTAHSCNLCPGKYYGNSAGMNCQRCHPSCLICNGPLPQMCTACNTTMYFFKNETSECILCADNGLYGDAVSGTCKACHPTCVSCIGPATTDCASCNITSYLAADKHCQWCPPGQFPDPTPAVLSCQPCDSSCVTCYWYGKTGCLTCDVIVSYFNPLVTTCSPCQFGQYGDEAGQQCVVCHANCRTCRGPTTTDCVTCRYTAYYNTSSSECIQCAAGTYGNNVTQECSPCEPSCLTCQMAGATGCLTCRPLIQFYKVSTSECISCSAGQFGNPEAQMCQTCFATCKECKGMTKFDCTECNFPGSFLNTTSGECIFCLSNQFGNNAQQKCQACHTSCITCNGPAVTNCLSCNTTNSFYDGSACVACAAEKYGTTGPSAACDDCHSSCKVCTGPADNNCLSCDAGLYFLDNTCLAACPDYYYGNTTVTTFYHCLACHYTCLTCSGPKETQCVRCEDYDYFFNNTCGPLCLKGYYKEQASAVGNNNLCKLCHPSCKLCFGPLESNCQACFQSAFYFNGFCKPCHATCQLCNGDSDTSCTSCASNKYLNKEKKCIVCDANCKTCKGATTYCTSCATGQFILNHICLPTCPQFYYGNSTSAACLQCNETCLFCNGPSDSQCTQCTENRVLTAAKKCQIRCPTTPLPIYHPETSACVAACPQRFYNNATYSYCKPCHADCLTCSGPLFTECLSCTGTVDGMFLRDFNGTCGQCPSHYFQEKERAFCVQCNSTCLECQNALADSCISCSSDKYLMNGTCTSICPPKHFYQQGTINVCFPCHCDCLLCDGPNVDNCTLCSTDRRYFQRQCVDACPPQLYFEDLTDPANLTCTPCHSSCFSCTGPGNAECVVCQQQRYFLQNTCLSECPTIGYYHRDSDMTCQICHATCETCRGELDTECESCPVGATYVLKKCLVFDCPSGQYRNTVTTFCDSCAINCETCTSGSIGSCLSCLPTKYGLNGECLNKCPALFYPDTREGQCYSCHSSCSTCRGPTNKDCLSCFSLTFLFENQCILSCPAQTFQNSVTNVCQICPNGCKVCNAAGCVECFTGFLIDIYDGNCYTTCPDGTYNDMVEMKCQLCSPTCETCSLIGENNCQSCSGGSGLFLGQCLAQCPKGYYNDASNVCQQCDFRCMECFGAANSQCSKCHTFFIKYNSYCILDCSNGFYPIAGQDRTCGQCFTGCKECTNNGQFSCKNCLAGSYFIGGNTCVPTCPNGQYGNDGSRTCQPCYVACLTCNGSESENCLTCKPNSYLLNGTCEEYCPVEYFQDDSQWQCIMCDVSCNGCKDSTITGCLQCNEGLFLQNTAAVSSSCLDTCPDGFYANDETLKCVACYTSCATCKGADSTECITCKPTLLYLEGSCLAACLNGYYANTTNNTCLLCHTNCKTCAGSAADNDCATCGNGLFLLRNTVGNGVVTRGRCENACPATGFYINLAGASCDACATGCESCSGTGATQCLTCYDNFYLNTVTSGCVVQCPVGKVNDVFFRKCSASCPTGSYLDSADNTCKSCNASCTACNSLTVCTSCKQGLILKDSATCVSSCGSHYFVDRNTQQCAACHAECAECTGALNSDCYSCPNTKFLHLGLCKSDCPNGLYQDTTNHICALCHYTCERCTGSTSSTCTKCPAGLYLAVNTCVKTCPDFFFADQTDRTCKDCPVNCVQCYANDANKCTKCAIPDYFLSWVDGLGGQCVVDCLSSQYQDPVTIECKDCFSTCLTCSGPSNVHCLSCASPLYFYVASDQTKQCLPSCPAGYFGQADRSCARCHESCYACSGALSTQCTACPDGQVLTAGKCVIRCKSTQYMNALGVCQNCASNCALCVFETGAVKCLKCKKSFIFRFEDQPTQCLTNCKAQAPDAVFKYSPRSFNVYADDSDTGYCIYKQAKKLGIQQGKCHQSCTKCFGYSDQQCLACTNPAHVLKDYRCVPSCSPQRYYDKMQKVNQCQACETKCLECTGQYSNQCSKCAPGFALFDTTCAIGCASGYFHNTLNDVCARCLPGCTLCFSMDDCQVCAQFMIVTSPTAKSCVEKCSNTQTGVQYGPNYICTACQSPCLTCQKLSTTCTSCVNGFIYFEPSNQCFAGCPFGFVPNAAFLACEPCDASVFCENCVTNPKTCTKCLSGYYLYSGSCFPSCEKIPGVSNQYNGPNNMCGSCHFTCASCRGTSESPFTCKQCILTSSYKYFYDDGNENTQCLSVCPPSTYTDTSTYMCKQCYPDCRECSGRDKNQCITCIDGLILYNSICYAKCPDKTVLNSRINVCLDCHPTCASCVGTLQTNCLSCASPLFLTVLGTCISDCGTGWFPVIADRTCQKCNTYCITCSILPDNCTQCAGNRDNMPACTCPTQTVISSTALTCPTCSFRCSGCNKTPFTCLTCASNRNQNSACSCPRGKYEINNQAECANCAFKCSTCLGTPGFCLTCKGNRITGDCVCPKGFYEDGVSKNCPRCHTICLTCITQNMTCTSCKGNRVASPLVSPVVSCSCPNGFFENYKSTNCPSCKHQCATCSLNSSNCLTCIGVSPLRHTAPSCACIDGYYDDPLQTECQKCRLVCATCDSYSNCLTCRGNRQKPDSIGNCPCDFDTLDREILGIPYCANDTLGIPDITFSDDLYYLVIDFGYEVTMKGMKNQLVFSREFCELVLDPQSDALMGSNPKALCAIDRFNETRFLVKFGDNPQIKENDTVLFNPDVLRFKKFNKFFLEFMLNTVHPAKAPFSPEGTLIGPPQNVTLCEEVYLNFTDPQFDGRKPLKVISWEMPLMSQLQSATLVQFLTTTMANAVAANQFYLYIPILTLESFFTFRFRIRFQNFQGQQGAAVYEFITATDEAPVIRIDRTYPFVFYPQETITITADIRHYLCSQTETHEVMDNLNGQWVQLSGQPQLFSPNPLLFVKKDTQVSQELEFAAFTTEPRQTYKLRVYVQLPVGSLIIEKYDEINVQVIPSPLIVHIKGGNQMNPFSQALHLEGEAHDPGVLGTEASKLGISCIWKCFNLNTGAQCQQANGDLLDLTPFTEKFVDVKEKRLDPYISYVFHMICTKLDITNFDAVTVIVTEIDIPALAVDIPPMLSQRRINLNEEIVVKLTYSGTSPDNLFYAGAIVYDYDVVATMVFPFLEFKFKIWDNFMNFTPGIDKISVRCSVYDPRFYMPSITTLDLLVNLSPDTCTLTVFSDNGQIPAAGVEYQNVFMFTVTNCNDTDLPLTFKYSYYTTWDLYHQDTVNGTTLSQNLISDFKLTDTLTTILPQGTKFIYNATLGHEPSLQPFDGKNIIIVMASVSDSQGGITNLTQPIEVQPNPNYDVNTFIQQWNTNAAINIDQEIQFLNLIALKLAALDYNSSVSTMNITTAQKEALANKQATLIQQQKLAYERLKVLRDATSSKATIEALQKSRSVLLDALKLVLDAQMLLDNLDDIDLFVQQQQQIIEQTIQQIETQGNNFILQRKKDAASNSIMACLKLIDSVIQGANKDKDDLITRKYILQPFVRANATNTTNTTDNTTNTTLLRQLAQQNKTELEIINEKIDNITLQNSMLMNESLKISQGFQKVSLINEPAKTAYGKGQNIKIQRVSPKILEEQLAPPRELALNTQLDDAMAEKNAPPPTTTNSTNSSNSSEEFKPVNFKLQDLKTNPYQTENDYPYPQQDSQVVAPEAKDDDGNLVKTKGQVNLQFRTPKADRRRILGQAPNLVCASKGQNGQWNADNCQLKEVEQSDGSKSSTCQCQQTSPTTIMDDIDQMFRKAAKNLEKAFSADALDALASGKFLDSVLFYVLCIQTFFFIYALIWGWGKDIQDWHIALEKKEVMKQVKQQDQELLKLNKDEQLLNDNDKNQASPDPENLTEEGIIQMADKVDKVDKVDEIPAFGKVDEKPIDQADKVFENTNKADNNQNSNRSSKKDDLLVEILGDMPLEQKFDVKSQASNQPLNSAKQNENDLIIDLLQNDQNNQNNRSPEQKETILIPVNLDADEEKKEPEQQQNQEDLFKYDIIPEPQPIKKEDSPDSKEKMVEDNNYEILPNEGIMKKEEQNKQEVSVKVEGREVEGGEVEGGKVEAGKKEAGKTDEQEQTIQKKSDEPPKEETAQEKKLRLKKEEQEKAKKEKELKELEEKQKKEEQERIKREILLKIAQLQAAANHFWFLVKNFHKLLQIIFTYNEEISRPIRFTIYYMQMLIFITITLLFDKEDKSVVEKIPNLIAYSIFAGVVNTICQKLTYFLLINKFQFLRVLGILIGTGIIGVCTWITLVFTALNDVPTLNRWAASYLFSYFQDMLINQQATIFVNYIIILKYAQSLDTESIIKAIIGKIINADMYGKLSQII